MSRQSDCIFCGAEMGSREHTFPASLGGRRMNKGILCGTCNGKFSPLDALLSRQLAFINGVIGVRPDRSSEPRPAQAHATEGPLLIDQTGKPSFATPRVIEDAQQPEGGKRVVVEFANERQRQKWVAEQRASGLKVKQESIAVGQRFLSDPIPIQWSFGGNDAFREIGRIALNFLAHRRPEVARLEALAEFKEWVEGKRLLKMGGRRFVWYAPLASFPVPDSPFKFGHQVLLVIGGNGIYGRVRFFSTFDLFVWFGKFPDCPQEATIFDIDPLAENPPNDLRETLLDPTFLPSENFSSNER